MYHKQGHCLVRHLINNFGRFFQNVSVPVADVKLKLSTRMQAETKYSIQIPGSILWELNLSDTLSRFKVLKWRASTRVVPKVKPLIYFYGNYKRCWEIISTTSVIWLDSGRGSNCSSQINRLIFQLTHWPDNFRVYILRKERFDKLQSRR